MTDNNGSEVKYHNGIDNIASIKNNQSMLLIILSVLLR
ncbi:hypothetical protein BMETH_1742_0 [methanotrophic bacterial endosymbiont of Bathymodiolus sp.]|nr:hypothetical protein BMETH_1742_0 [methanotrophic bacterial endosymbiont of Bathymodiolus sp.]